MGSDVEFFGQLTGAMGKRQAWRAAMVDAKTAPKSGLKGQAKRFRGDVGAFAVATLLDGIAEIGGVDETGRSTQLAGIVEQGLFWETWAAELAKALVVAARLGLGGWLWAAEHDDRVRLRIDGKTVVVEVPSEADWKRAQKSAAYRLLDATVPDDVKAAVDAAMDRFDHGTAATGGDAFEAVLAAIERLDDEAVRRALGKCGDVPSKRGRERPKKLFKDKAGLIEIARKTAVAEQQGTAVELLSIVDVARCTPLAIRLATEKPRRRRQHCVRQPFARWHARRTTRRWRRWSRRPSTASRAGTARIRSSPP
ncbi:MAG: hypothetical protein RIF41_12575 [Polyangiaceae bacterium]